MGFLRNDRSASTASTGADPVEKKEVAPNLHVAEQLAILEQKTGVSVVDTIARLMRDHSHNAEPLTAEEKRGEYDPGEA